MIEKEEAKEIFLHMLAEVDCAKKYRECALKLANKAPNVAERYVHMADQKIKCADTLLEMLEGSSMDSEGEEKAICEFLVDIGKCVIKMVRD